MIEKLLNNSIFGKSEKKEPIIEQELNPETIKNILEKVKDINSYGTAYSAIGRVPYPESLEHPEKVGAMGANENLSKKTLANILEKGLSDTFKSVKSAKDYKKKLNKGGVQFNVIGRSDSVDGIIKKIKHDSPYNNYMAIPGQIGLIFNLNKFKEMLPVKYAGRISDSGMNLGLNEFMACEGSHARLREKIREELKLKDEDMSVDNPKIKEYIIKKSGDLSKLESEFSELKKNFPEDFKEYRKHIGGSYMSERAKKIEAKYNELRELEELLYHFDEKGLKYPDEEFGFMLSPRVAPRDFQGIILNKYTTADESKLNHIFSLKDYRDKLRDEQGSLDEKIIKSKNKQLIDNVVKVLRNTYGDKPSLLIPIYDIEGSLLWPVEMEYEKVKEMVSER